MAPIPCLGSETNECPMSEQCFTLPFWAGLDEVINQYIDSVTLEQLAQSLPVDYTYMDWDGGHEWAFWDRSLVYAIDRFVNPGYADQILKGWSSEAFTTERG